MTDNTSNKDSKQSIDQTLDQAIQASSEPVITKTVTAEECRLDIEQTASNDAESGVESDTKQVRSTQEILDMIRDRPKSNDSSSDSSSKAAEPTDFEKSLFVDGVVDWESYKELDELFGLFGAEARDVVDIRYASYQDGLLHLLQHCYGYFYSLMHDSERYQRDIKEINNAISSENISSNKANALEVKIIKLVWKGARIDKRRISTYANLLKNAWCKGKYDEGTTDSKGSILPSQFTKQVKLYGGINNFSRESVEQLRKQEELEKAGYKCNKDRKIDIARDAISAGVFKYNDYELQLKDLGTLSPSSAFFDGLRDGATVVTLCSWDRKQSKLVVRCAFDQNAKDGVVDKAELQFFESLRKAAIDKKGY